MKKFIWFSALVLAVAAVAAEAPPSWARVYYGNYAAMNEDIIAPGMDVVSGAAGKYVDVIAPVADLAALQEKGYRVEILAADAGAVIAALPPDLGLYHTYQEMLTELQGEAAAYPAICALSDIGDTWEGRDVWCLKVSDNPGVTEDEPRLYVCGDHHARELMTVEIPLYFIKNLLQQYRSDPDITYFVDNYEIYFLPMVNPDGHVYVEGHSTGNPNYWWRKNRRNNGNGTYGVDLNRNYSYMWGYDNSGSSGNPGSDTYRGPSAFSEPETTAVRNLMISTPFDFGLDYHSYGEYIIVPWDYIGGSQSHTEEHEYFMSLANGMNGELGNRYRAGTASETVGYLVNGGSVDYIYGERTEKNKFYGWCFEVNTAAQGGFGPPDTLIEPTCLEHYGVLLWFLNFMRDYTGVELAGFEGRARDGAAVLTWETSREHDNAGFNLYRAEAGSRDVAKVNRALIQGRTPYRYVDAGVVEGKTYDYILEDVALSGQTKRHGPVRVDMTSALKASFALAQNAPNPARSATTITFTLPAAGDARITVYDLAGRKIKEALAGSATAGENRVAVDVSALAPGVYTYRLEAAGAAATRRMVVAR